MSRDSPTLSLSQLERVLE